jgi:hypothetical protein
MDRAKPFCIAKREVWEAYKQVKANRGAAGADGQSIEDFDRDLSKNLYRIWNRMSSGSYFPPPVRRVDIPKADTGGTRPLGIPTVSDRIAQMVVKRHLEPILEPVFHRDSYGYRVKSLPIPTPISRPIPTPSPGISVRGSWSVPAEAAWRNDRLKFAEVQFADSAQRLGGRAVLKVLRQTIQPGREFYLRFYEAGDVVGPAPGPAAMISRSAVADDRHTGRARGTISGLALCVGHGGFTD